ncbi:23S rRNA (guanosine(2251)-2'-O)-methyltransferase RlmB [Mycoplasma phocoenae]|uniref:23S rRNA (Guanosine(2251)-2'-O)-methyltransferase RlmB n=1 Tax=Mycoplasma phocoenae TaxID=754517 RepID=A0A858U5E1_9MOLU|nr:23S rRNA (guanosine(2251)-2'-O)-methyltransferase RlmB [Mycoplasma phocoenae]
MNKNIICGRNSVLDAVDNKFNIETIYIQKGSNIKINFDNIKFISREEMNKMTRENHQGIIAVIKPFNYADFNQIINKMIDKVLILDHIQDPHNLGAIIRSANVFGVNWIIIPEDRAAAITPTVLKISSGGFANMNIVKVASIYTAIDKLKSAGFWIYSTALGKNAKDISKVKFNENSVLVIGNEAKGVSNTILKHSDELIYIPQKGTVQSLNASVAAGISLYFFTK